MSALITNKSGKYFRHTELSYSKFPKAKFVLAVFDRVIDYYLDEFLELYPEFEGKPDEISNWYSAGIGQDSQSTYYVMDFKMFYINIQTGQVLSDHDYNIHTGGAAFTAKQASDVMIMIDSSQHSHMANKLLPSAKELLCR